LAGSAWRAEHRSRRKFPGRDFADFRPTFGHGYRIIYWIGRNPDGGINPRTGFIDEGGGQAQFLYSGSGSRSNIQWEQEIFDFVANDASSTLTFAADPATAGQFYGPALDNVSIDAIPEPATCALVILGFGTIGGAFPRKATRRATLHFASAASRVSSAPASRRRAALALLFARLQAAAGVSSSGA
jgi:hypothetical protein